MSEGQTNVASETQIAHLTKLTHRTDQMVTAHSILRDRYEARSNLLSGINIFSAAVVTFLSVASLEIKDALLPVTINPDYLLATLAFVSFCGSLAELHFRWREKASVHADAANSYARLKLSLAEGVAEKSTLTHDRYVSLKTAYDSTSDAVARIPDRQFVKLKAAHKRKINLSSYLDDHPSANILLTRIKFWCRDNIGYTAATR